MSNIDKRALRGAAEKAGSEEWCAFIDTKSKTYSVHTPGDNRCGDVVKWAGFDGQQRAAAKAKFIAAANPATVLALLDELEAVQKTSAARLGAIDTTHKMFQRERDRADAAEKRSAELSQKADIYDMLRQDYGLQGSLVDFVDWQSKRIAELEAREVVLPSAHDVHPLGPQSAKIFCEFHRSIVNRCADEIRKVGVKVSIKGN